jgi:hypothetical protein
MHLTNDLARYQNPFADIEPFSGTVRKGFIANFLGTETETEFCVWNDLSRMEHGPHHMTTRRPEIAVGEGFFEWVSVLEAVKEAEDRFVMLEIGGGYGARAVDAHRMLEKLNPMPCKLGVVEADPGRFSLALRHFENNGIDPKDHWLIHAMVSDSNRPMVFPFGGIYGDNNAIADTSDKMTLVDNIVSQGIEGEVLRNIMLDMRTGVVLNFDDGATEPRKYEIAIVSTVTIADLVRPFERVDLCDIDIQSAESYTVPVAMPHLNRKVRRVHLATHGADVHDAMRNLFLEHGWVVTFDFPPNKSFESDFGDFSVGDGILAVRNPRL